MKPKSDAGRNVLLTGQNGFFEMQFGCRLARRHYWLFPHRPLIWGAGEGAA
jgi:hypothetical protein